jgi:prepilin-type processing-associated H-X9-DG protein
MSFNASWKRACGGTALYAEGQNPRGPAIEVFLRQGIIRMILQSGVVDPAYFVVLTQELRRCQCIFADAVHAQSQGFDALQNQETVERRNCAARVAQQCCADLARAGPGARFTTHGAEECLDACRLYSRQLIRALNGENKAQVLFADGHYRDKSEDSIRGTGYVVDCLEAALWCFWTTNSFCEAILKAANLGEDADTTAAVCGQLAGAYYGSSGIPAVWKQKLAMGEMIQELADRLYQQSQSRTGQMVKNAHSMTTIDNP